MKYSDAIRMGGVLSTRQVRGIDRDHDGGTCANQGALLAVGATHLQYAWPWAWDLSTACPVCGYRAPLVTIVATHLNDRHLWTRDQIADWVVKQERKLAPEGAVVPGLEESEMECARRTR